MRCLFRRRAALLGALTLFLLLAPSSVGATVGWCAGDPVIKIDGKVADILLSSYDTLHETATGPVQIVITIPATSTGEVLAVDRGFGGFGYDIAFEPSNGLKATESDTPIKIAVLVPSSDKTIPLRVDFLPRSSGLMPASAEGTTGNPWVIVTTS